MGESTTPYGILALWAANGLSIVYWAYWQNWLTPWYICLIQTDFQPNWHFETLYIGLKGA